MRRLPSSKNPVFRGFLIRFRGPKNWVEAKKAKYAYIYYDGKLVEKITFTAKQKSLIKKQMLVVGRVETLDRTRVRNEKLAKSKALREAKAAKAKRALRRLELIEERRLQEIKSKKAAEKRKATIARNKIEKAKAIKEAYKKRVATIARNKAEKARILEEERLEKLRQKEQAERELLERKIARLKLPEFSFGKDDFSYVTGYTHSPNSDSDVTRSYAGTKISSTRAVFRFKKPVVLDKRYKTEILEGIKLKVLAEAKEEYYRMPGSGDFLLRIMTLEDGAIKSGYSASPGRFHAETWTELKNQIEVLFDMYSEAHKGYLGRTYSRSLHIRGFQMDQIVGVTHASIDTD